MDVGRIEWGGISCIGIAQDRDQWKSLENTVINFWVV
jgi:hypothetical protein